MKRFIHWLKIKLQKGHEWSDVYAPYVLNGKFGNIIGQVCSCGYKDTRAFFLPDSNN